MNSTRIIRTNTVIENAKLKCKNNRIKVKLSNAKFESAEITDDNVSKYGDFRGSALNLFDRVIDDIYPVEVFICRVKQTPRTQDGPFTQGELEDAPIQDDLSDARAVVRILDCSRQVKQINCTLVRENLDENQLLQRRVAQLEQNSEELETQGILLKQSNQMCFAAIDTLMELLTGIELVGYFNKSQILAGNRGLHEALICALRAKQGNQISPKATFEKVASFSGVEL